MIGVDSTGLAEKTGTARHGHKFKKIIYFMLDNDA